VESFCECDNEPSGSAHSGELSSDYTTDSPSSSAQLHRVTNKQDVCEDRRVFVYVPRADFKVLL
jgi:hypothetical protein